MSLLNCEVILCFIRSSSTSRREQSLWSTKRGPAVVPTISGTRSQTSTPAMTVRSLFRSTSASLIGNTVNVSGPINVFQENANETLETSPPISSTDYVPTKTVSCENISSLSEGKSNFPHAFLRSKPPKSYSLMQPTNTASVPAPQAVLHPSYTSEVQPDELKDSLRHKLKAVSEENFSMTWLRRNQASLKMKLNPHYPRTRNKERASSTQSVNTETIVYHSPIAPTNYSNNISLTLPKATQDQYRLPGNRSSLYISSTESGYESDGMKHDCKVRKLKKTECDADSGVSTGTHSETNSDSGSLTGNDTSFDQQCAKGDGSLKPVSPEKHKNTEKRNVELIGYCKCPSVAGETSKLNLTDEEKLVPAISEDIHPRLPEPANITSLRQKFLVSQLSRQCNSTSASPTPSQMNTFIDEADYQWWEKSASGRSHIRGLALSQPMSECYSKPPMSLPLSLAPSCQIPPPRTYRMMRLSKDSSGELGIYITAKKNNQGTTTGYVIAHIEKGGLTDR